MERRGVSASRGSRPATAGLFAALGALCRASAALADDEVTVTPDRPSISNSTWTAPPGTVQVETGVEYGPSIRRGVFSDHRAALQTVIRVGLVRGLEVRVDAEPLVSVSADPATLGYGDLELGFKLRLLDTPAGGSRPSLGVQPFFKPPLAAPPIGSGRADFGAIALLGLPLPADLCLDVNVGVAALGQAGDVGFMPQVTSQVALSWQVGPRLSLFVEGFVATAARPGDDATVGLDVGATWLPHRRVAIDLALQASHSGHGPDLAARAGLSFLVGG